MSDKCAEIEQRYRDDPNMYWVTEVEWLLGEVKRLRAVRECACDPPGSGEEFCTGHCVLRAENERLRGTLEFALDNDRKQSENAARLIAEVERLRTVEIVSLEQEVIAHVDEIERLREQLGAAKRLIEIVRAREIGTAGGVGAAFEAYDALGDANGA